MANLDSTHLKAGDKAPDFEGVDQDGQIVKLSDFKGQKLVLFFYPKDNTPGCTKEVCNLRDNYQLLQKQGYKLLGVSADSQHKHRNFIDKFKLPFPLLSDPDRNVISAYGVWGRKKFMGREFDGILRTTFVIDDGTIQDVITKVNTQDHANQILP
ncbi:MAG: thioredoxin-dependent thiol peroxidase [Saprospiraceae bacterium]|nr:thioredoxin-dependent thiol peroxidase [Saprospiraceae bacterium]